MEVSVRVRGVRGEYVYLFDLSLSPAASFIRTSHIDSCCHEGANLQVCRTESPYGFRSSTRRRSLVREQ